MEFPEQLKKIIGTRFGCEICQDHFVLEEIHAASKKKSKTWTLGTTTWGVKEPQVVECFIIKCPSCGNPRETIIISLRKPVSSLLSAQMPARVQEAPSKPLVQVQVPTHALSSPPRRFERRPPPTNGESKK